MLVVEAFSFFFSLGEKLFLRENILRINFTSLVVESALVVYIQITSLVEGTCFTGKYRG